MARLIVEAVSNQKRLMDSTSIQICVSVSRAETGEPVTKLKKNNFKITNLDLQSKTNPNDSVTDYSLTVEERTWDPKDSEASGVYDLILQTGTNFFGDKFSFNHGENFSFGLQVSVSEKVIISSPATVVSKGQTIVSVFNINEAW